MSGNVRPIECGVRWLACAYLRWRYGGDVYALKPPLGFSEFVPCSLWDRAMFNFWLKPRWQIELRLFNRYGHEMRAAWSA